MAEKIVSPGVFTEEKDLSFLPQGIGEIGAAFIGPTVKGPAFVPTIVESGNEFVQKFGPTQPTMYTPYAVQNYLKNAGRTTIVRTLGIGGYKVQAPIYLTVSGSGFTENLISVLHPTFVAVNDDTTDYFELSSVSSTITVPAVAEQLATASVDPLGTITDGEEFAISGSGGTVYTFIATGSWASETDATPLFYFGTGSDQATAIASMSAEINTASTGLGTTATATGIVLSATAAGSAGNSLSITADGTETFLEGGVDAVLQVGNNADFVLQISGSYTTDSSTFTNATNKNGNSFSSSLDPSDPNNVGDIFGFLPTGIEPVYNYVLFNTAASASLSAGDAIVKMYLGNVGSTEWDFQKDYQAASTPWITSQKVGGNAQNLFKFHHMSHGDNTNYEFKAQLENIRPAGTIPGTDYGAFNVVIRTVDQDNIYGSPYSYDDSDSRPNVIETFLNCNLNPDSPNFIQRKIGDKFITVDATGKLSSNGDYSNKSAYIRVEVADPVKAGALSSNLVPFGFAAPFSSIPAGIIQPNACSYVQDQNIGGIYNKKKPWGYDFNESDNYNYLRALPVDADLTVGNNVAFYLGDFNQPAAANTPTAAAPYVGAINLTSDTSPDSRKFIVPFQGGFDGWKPHLQKRTGTHIQVSNSQGFNLTAGEWGDTAYRRALAAISNPDEFDINMLITPGILQELHSGLVARAIEVCEDRSDAFYVMDGFTLEANIASAISTMQTVDTNYAGVYYPWVKTLDLNKNRPMWVPPSVVMPGIIAYSDKVSEPWFAPAGLNRGGISEAIEAYTRLTHDERDDLYENRINPIASFPNEGVVAWGQKTLQAKPSALDRINVRRLLIALKKFIASSSRYLVFENNTAVTRNRFLNIVNPYLESVQQRQGLYAFKVVMDETNNTPDIIDRNIMYGQIFIQPAKTAEFIVLDFNILPTGAAFPE